MCKLALLFIGGKLLFVPAGLCMNCYSNGMARLQNDQAFQISILFAEYWPYHEIKHHIYGIFILEVLKKEQYPYI
jgi:hypothetical protein